MSLSKLWDVLDPPPNMPDITIEPFERSGFVLTAHTARARAILWREFEEEQQMSVAHRDIIPIMELLYLHGLHMEYNRGHLWTA